jgi:hypothetical protein
MAASEREAADANGVEALLALLEGADRSARRRLAGRPDLPEAVLYRLAGDEFVDVRIGIAERTDLPANWIAALSRDEYQVRAAIARRPGLSVALMEELGAEAQHPQVRCSIAERPDLPAALMQALARDPDDSVRYFLAKRRDLPPELVEALACDSDGYVRWMIAGRESLPVELIERLTKDSEPIVRRAANRQQAEAASDSEPDALPAPGM